MKGTQVDNKRREEIKNAMIQADQGSKHLQPAVCITLSVEDLVDRGFDPSKLTQEQFDHLARKIGEDCMETWWMAMEGHADYDENIASFAEASEMDDFADDDEE